MADNYKDEYADEKPMLITSEMLDWKFDNSVAVELDCWTSHPTLAKDLSKKDPDTKHPIGAIKQVLTFLFTNLTLRTALKASGANYRITYQNGYSRVGSDEKFKNVNKYLIDEKGKTRTSIEIIIDKFFTGKEKMTDGERLGKTIGKITNIDVLRNAREELAAKIKAIEAENK